MSRIKKILERQIHVLLSWMVLKLVLENAEGARTTPSVIAFLEMKKN